MAAMDFPPTPTVGQLYPDPPTVGVPQYRWDGGAWLAVSTPEDLSYVRRTGDTMSGPLTMTGAPAMITLAGDPTIDMHAAPKRYVDSGVGGVGGGLAAKVAKAGDTMTGHLSLPTAPAAANAVRKDYVDAADAAVAIAATLNVNVLINADFRVNQSEYVSAAVLAAGVYGHDQWKAGAAGGDYSFTQLKSSTQITIATGKSLIQPIEDVNVSGGSYVLTWTGTAQARAGVDTLTPSGAYAISPLLIAGQTAGMPMSVEFNAGTLGTVKLERGSTPTPFVMRPYDQELVTCQRYFSKTYMVWNGSVDSGQTLVSEMAYFSPMRAIPTGTITYVSPANLGISAIVPYSLTSAEFRISTVSAGNAAFEAACSFDARL